ncbi:hypothetical protein QBC47DRAFT_363754 [Echria macrotheca]|uniref:Uncharacterized protein n=1 Tax=Echria macrotheca TaxID=438768 RepID=A0AAJ0F2B3_9PEZI|nr:hypothetical protein QBC47DRAFT_363754 [Echria macrotheca]
MSHINRARNFPFEERDQSDTAEAWYNEPIRSENQRLALENMSLKRLLRENGISWSETSALSLGLPESRAHAGTKRRRLRSSKVQVEQPPLPTLPTEIQLVILEMALTSDHPIVDPMSKLRPGTQTQEEGWRGNQIAIGCLAVCKVYHHEGTRFLWKNNSFVFTSHSALRNFANLSPDFRKNITDVTLRIIATYYDDKMKSHSVTGNVPGQRIKIKCVPRRRENTLSRKGYKSYSWLQLIDFLDALRPPFDPSHPKKQDRPRLFPNLTALRIDFVNFPREYLMYPDHDLHRLAAHDLGCTIDELMLTGLPHDERGRKVMLDLSGMVRDDGLLLKARDTFIQNNGQLRKMDDCEVSPKIVRPWKLVAREMAAARDPAPEVYAHHHHHTHDDPELEATPEVPGHPESMWKKKKTIWKLTPLTRDSSARKWTEFSRTWGSVLEQYDADVDEDDSKEIVCDECGEVHDPLTDHDF